MRFAYYPGCSAKSSCAELNEAMHNVAPRLALQLFEIESATCTGAREIRAIDPVGFLALNVRILALAEREDLPLMTICNTCTLNLIDANARFLEDEDIARQVNERLAKEGLVYRGTTRITHFLWVLFEDIGMESLRGMVVNPLKGFSVAAFYGCHITRPARRYGFIDSRNNRSLEQLSELLGCKPIDYSGRTECCGFHTAAHDERIAIKLTGSTYPVGEVKWGSGVSDPMSALPHRTRQFPEGDRTRCWQKTGHASAASPATRWVGVGHVPCRASSR